MEVWWRVVVSNLRFDASSAAESKNVPLAQDGLGGRNRLGESISQFLAVTVAEIISLGFRRMVLGSSFHAKDATIFKIPIWNWRTAPLNRQKGSV